MSLYIETLEYYDKEFRENKMKSFNRKHYSKFIYQ